MLRTTFVSIALLVSALAAQAEEPVCVGQHVAPPDSKRWVAEAVDVLKGCGHDPADYRLELRDEVASAPTAVFLPVGQGRYPVAVSLEEPCALVWVRGPRVPTPWQTKVLAVARGQAESAWSDPDGDDIEIDVAESRDLLGVRLVRSTGEELNLVISKTDLTLVQTDMTLGTGWSDDGTME
jgi:hypothetical protein